MADPTAGTQSTGRQSSGLEPEVDTMPATSSPGASTFLMSLEDAVAALTGPGCEFEVTTETIRGVPTLVWGGCPRSLAEVVRASLEWRDREFLVYYDQEGQARRLTYGEHFEQVCALAHALRNEFGVRKGDRVALAARNLPEWSVSFFAATLAGAIVVPLNAWWTGPEMVYGLSDSGASVLIADGERLDRLRQHLAEVDLSGGGILLDGGAGPGSGQFDLPERWKHYEDVLARAGVVSSLPEVDLEPDDDATIFYTSGTTGFPKGALGTHRNICSNLRAAQFLKRRGEIRTGIIPAEDEQHVSLLSVPLFHVTGCHSTLLPSIGGGSKLVFTYRFDAEQTVRIIESERINTFGGVPTLVWRVLESPNFKDHDLSSVTRVAYGGAPPAPELVRRLEQEFPLAMPSNGYGLTETSAITSTNAGPEYKARPKSAGMPMPVCQVKVVGESGQTLPTGEIGELWIHGPNVIKGYWKKPEATGETFTEGWLHTGDLAFLDPDGFITICDRAKDMVIRAGENIYCAEVEAALHEHPDVVTAAVYGVADRVLGEEVAATVQHRPSVALTETSLREFLTGRIASFKIPRHWDFGDSALPLNANGKVLKKDLRQALEAKLTGTGAA